MPLEIIDEPLEILDEGETPAFVLPPLDPDEREIIDPLIPPTSGLRIELLEPLEGDEGKSTGMRTYRCPTRRYALFLRVFKAISLVLLDRKGRGCNVLVTSDERPTSDRLARDAIRILAADGHDITIHAPGDDGSQDLGNFNHSGLSTPYSSASLALDDGLDAVICITASHNSLVWNGIKFYLDNPVPIAGNLMKDISARAVALEKIPFKQDGVVVATKDYEKIINAYVKDLVSRVIPVEAIRGETIVIWPYMGEAPGISNLMEDLGVNLVKVNETMEPPDPTVNLRFDEVVATLKEHGARVAVLLDADRDRIVFIVKTGDEFVELSPNELYTAMHNIITKDFGRLLVNVRTVPSDPRSDDSATCTIESGVGYKHLGMIQLAACGLPVDESQFRNALIYGKEGNSRTKLDSPDAVRRFLATHLERALFPGGSDGGGNDQGDRDDKDNERENPATTRCIMALWEESGGHTFNVTKPVLVDGKIDRLESELPVIGDKFPAPAILVLCELISRGYNLLEAIDTSIKGTRVKITADDKRKRAIMEKLSTLVGKSITVAGNTYRVMEYRDNKGDLDIIGFTRDGATIFARPSGTGNSVRVYIFGDKETCDEEVAGVAAYLESM